jgi:hypothetical protein
MDLAQDVSKLQPTWLWVIGDEWDPMPSIERQIKRMMCLIGLNFVSYYSEEMASGNANQETISERLAHIQSWIAINALTELSDYEMRFLATPNPEMSRRDIVDGNWALQAAGTIGWALGLLDWKHIPDGFELGDFPRHVADLSLESITNQSNPRHKHAIELMNSVSCAYLWRVRQQQFVKNANLLKRPKYKRYIREFVSEVDKTALAPHSVDGDFSINGAPFFKLDDDDMSFVGSHANERLRALNWLLGQEEQYSDISCDT